MNSKDSTLWILIALLLVVILLSGGGMMGSGMGFGVSIKVFFWGAIIWFVILLINAGPGQSEETPESAQTIVKKRYAKGEITREQLLEMEEELKE